ncbi:hypothetical protein D3C81_1198840 [compost metagenome]
MIGGMSCNGRKGTAVEIVESARGIALLRATGICPPAEAGGARRGYAGDVAAGFERTGACTGVFCQAIGRGGTFPADRV